MIKPAGIEGLRMEAQASKELYKALLIAVNHFDLGFMYCNEDDYLYCSQIIEKYIHLKEDK